MYENLLKFEIIKIESDLVWTVSLNDTFYTISFDSKDDEMAMLTSVHSYLHGLVGYKDTSK